MSLAIIAAIADNGVIGRDNTLPWHLPDDLKWFKRHTLDHTVIMGRHTYESIGRPLPRRRFIVVSRNPAFAAHGVVAAPSLAAALAAAGQDDIFIIGGAALFREALPLADRLYITRIHADVAGDVHFPDLDIEEWIMVSSEPHAADERHAYAFSFEILDRKRPGQQ